MSAISTPSSTTETEAAAIDLPNPPCEAALSSSSKSGASVGFTGPGICTGPTSAGRFVGRGVADARGVADGCGAAVLVGLIVFVGAFVEEGLVVAEGRGVEVFAVAEGRGVDAFAVAEGRGDCGAF